MVFFVPVREARKKFFAKLFLMVFCFALVTTAVRNKSYNLATLHFGLLDSQAKTLILDGPELISFVSDLFGVVVTQLKVVKNLRYETSCTVNQDWIILSNNCFLKVFGDWDNLKSLKAKATPNFAWHFFFGISLFYLAAFFQINTLLFVSAILLLHSIFLLRIGNLQFYVIFPLLVAVAGVLKIDDSKGDDEIYEIQRMREWRLWVWLTIVLIVFCSAKLLSFERFNQWSYHPDESIKLRQVDSLLIGNFDPRKMLHPPLMLKTFALLKKIFPEVETENLARIAQTFWGILGVVAVAWLTQILFGSYPAKISVALSLSSILIFISSSYLKEDILLFALTALSFCFYFFWERRRLLVFAFSSLFFAWASFAAKYTGLLNVAVISAMFVLKTGSIKTLLYSAFMGFIVIPLLFPEMALKFEAFIKGILYEGLRGVREIKDFQLPGLDYFFVYSFYKTYINYENVFYGVLILFSWIYAYRRGYYRELILCLIYYFFFEYNAWKPPPQPERYLLITYIFIIPLVSFLVAQSQLFIIRSLFLLSVGYNLVQQIILASSDLSSEKKLSEYVCNLPEQIVVHTGYVPRIECDKQILHLNLATARKIMSLKLPANQTLFITTNTHLYRYFEFRLARKHVRYSSLLFHLIKRLKLVKVIGSPILQKAYLNNTYYVYRSDTDFSDVLRSNFRFFRL